MVQGDSMKHILYHKTLAPNGEIFEGDEKELLSEMEGWQDNPDFTDEVCMYPEALVLLKGEGLNHSSYTRIKLNKDKVTQTDKASTKNEYKDIINYFKGRIRKQGHDWFI